ncbi:PP2C family protein-serine/threonine phosphatase [Gryllotalpicola reticulitermitis]|uniref:PP2C family protein-serine/threonine phosphatase n=1 Tax=Gryllotalpicola reticulitermitis TaxID=1184153 RepID=A0ABV8Q8M9_9MICO
MAQRLEVSAHTETGRVRAINEDSFLAADPMFFVADGMGGHSFGDRASQAAIAALAARVPAGSDPSPDDVREAVASANYAVRDLSEPEDRGAARAGTTLTGVARVATDTGPHWMVVNIGDSRVYSWDGRALEQVTVDHSAVQELLDTGAITPEQAMYHPERNVITRALGADDIVEPDVWVLPATGTRTFMICSDGLTKELSDQLIASILAGDVIFGDEPEGSIAPQLVEAADVAGGHDNITVIVLSVHADRTTTNGDANDADDAEGDTDDTIERPSQPALR